MAKIEKSITKNKSEIIYNLIAGIIIGAGSIMPAFSGGSVAVAMNIYEKLIYVANEILRLLKYIFVPNEEYIKKYIDKETKKINFFQRIWLVIKIGIENFGTFLIPLVLGAIISILLLAKVLNYAMEKNPLLLTSIFLGLMIGTIPGMFKEAISSEDKKLNYIKKEEKENIKGNIKKIFNKNNIINMIIFSVITIIVTYFSLLENGFGKTEQIYTFINSSKDLITLLFMGAMIAFSLIVPGVSGTLLLMMIGRYKALLTIINEFDIIKLAFCGVGVVLGAIPLIYLMEKFLKNYKQKTYFGVLGFVIGSIIKIVVDVFSMEQIKNIAYGNIKVVAVIIVSALVGYFLIKIAEKIKEKNEMKK